MRISVFVILFSLFALISCNNSNNEKYLAELDELLVQLKNAEKEYSNFDSAAISNIRKQVKTTCKRVRNPYDSLLNETIIPYSHIDKSIKQILRMDVRIRKDIVKSRSQIKDLYHDIENNLVDSIPLIMYMDDETRAVEMIIEKMEYNILKSLHETKKFDSLHPIVENLLISSN